MTCFRTILGMALACLLFAVPARAGEVVVTIPPLHALVQGVMGDTATAALLVDGAKSPHGFQLKPSQMRMLQEADVIFYIDIRFEQFLSRALQAKLIKGRHFSMVKEAGLHLLPRRYVGFEHDHGHDHSESAVDLHVWLSPDNARKIIRFVQTTLGKRFPEHERKYAANANILLEQLRQLDRQLQERLQPLQGRAFMVLHDAYQYFETHYQLSGMGGVMLDTMEQPSATRILGVREMLKKRGVICVFSEPQYHGKLVDAIIEGTHVKRGMLDPVGGSLSDGKNGYLYMLKQMGTNIQHCLEPGDKAH